MKITALITEYNPFHNGHLYHMEQAKKCTGADYLLVLMSGSHVQRGEPAVFDKYTRTRMALAAGADLVLELPAAFSTASAREFASCSIALLTALGAVDFIVFGSECGELSPLQRAAALLSAETAEFQSALQQQLKSGMTYPQARAAALKDASLSALLLSPNNLLGIEYLRAAQTQNSPIRFQTIRRAGSAYHEQTLTKTAGFPSASALREALKQAEAAENEAYTQTNRAELLFSGRIPDCCLSALSGCVPVFADDYSLLLQDRILTLLSKSSFAKAAEANTAMISDLTPELLSRLCKAGPQPLSFSQRVQTLKSRHLTYTRVSRALLHLILDLRQEDILRWKEEGYAPYARILGFRKESASLLKVLKQQSSIPLITKMADAEKRLSPSAIQMLRQEVRAAHLYQAVRSQKGAPFQHEYIEGVILQ